MKGSDGREGAWRSQKWEIQARLTGRDKAILRALGEYGCLSAGRIRAQFWSTDEDSRTYERRLSQLKKWNLIEKVLGDSSSVIGLRLTKTGQRMLRQFSGQSEVLVNRRAYKTAFEHDQWLFDIRRILEKSPLIRDFRPEAEIRRTMANGNSRLLHWENAPLFPDAMFLFSVPGKELRVAVELELTVKSKRRYGRIFRHHLLSQNWQLVLYIVKNEPSRRQLMEILQNVKTKDVQVILAKKISGIYFSTLEDFLSKGLAAPMTNGKKEISFEQMAQELVSKL